MTPLACPFCGEMPAFGDCTTKEDESGECYGYAYVECPSRAHFCGVHADTVEQAIAEWNKRSGTAA